jgi:hypothetical protein
MRAGRWMLAHWRGELQPLSAFLVAGLVVPLLATAAIGLATGAVLLTAEDLRTVAVVGLAHAGLIAAVAAWALVGVIRTLWRMDSGPRAAGLLLLLVAILATAVLRLPSWIATGTEYVALARGADPMGVSADIILDGDEITISGMLSQGTADRFAAVLGKAKGVTRIYLDSPGGRMLEASRMAAMIQTAKVDTTVDGECMSACTTLLLAGEERCMLAEASIGFHQATADGNDRLDDALIGSEQADELIAAGVDAKFARRAAAIPNADMWTPSEREMLDAGVLTHGHGASDERRPGGAT